MLNEKGDLAILGLTPTTAPQDEATSTLLKHLRADVIPAVVGDSSAEVSVTGGTAMTDDVSQRLQDRMPLFLGAVIGLSFLVLMLVFRSILVPLKAAALNVLSVGAAYGVVVAVFQWGWGASLIGVHETVPIMPLAPMLMFAILFGLSMDYEVFLLSRVREQYLKHRDPKRAVVEGVGSTARVITSAALIMIAVFGAFILGSDHVAQDVRRRPRRRRASRRDVGPDGAGPGGDEPARAQGLVASGVAGPPAAHDRPRGWRGRRPR